MQYCKDIGAEFYRSKLNLLSIECAKYNHSVRFYEPDVHDIVMMQAYAGRVLVPQDTTNYRQIILHDFDERYIPYIKTCMRVYCIGQYEYPDFEKYTVRFPSYPIAIDDYYYCGPNSFDVVIGGEIETTDDMQFILDSLPSSEVKTVALVCSGDRSGGSKMLAATVAGAIEKRIPGVRIYSNSNLGNVMIDYLYRTARYLIHAGDAKGGYLHSLSEYAKLHGATVITKPCKPVELVDIKNFCLKCGISV